MKTGKKVYLKSGKVQLLTAALIRWSGLSGQMPEPVQRSAGKTQCLILFPGWQRVWSDHGQKDGKDSLD